MDGCGYVTRIVEPSDRCMYVQARHMAKIKDLLTGKETHGQS